MNYEDQSPQDIAIKAIQYLAGDEEQLIRFFNLTGCDPDSLRQNAQSDEFLAGVLEFFMGNEPTLLAFSAQYSIKPEEVSHAWHKLGGIQYS